MDRETVSYVRHIMSSDFVQLDFFNAMIALAIVVVSFFAFVSGGVTLFGTVFVLGAFLAFFNAIKSYMKRSVLGIIVFGMMTVALAVMALVVFKILPVS